VCSLVLCARQIGAAWKSALSARSRGLCRTSRPADCRSMARCAGLRAFELAAPTPTAAVGSGSATPATPPTPHHPPRRRLRRSQYREAGGGEGSAAAGPRQLWRGRWTAATARSSSSGGSRTEVGGGIKPLAFGEFVEMGLIMGYQEPVPAEVLLTHVTGVAKRGADRHLIENRVGGSRGGVARPLNRSFPDLLFFS
jgi:hypothetical protein